jgi:peroxiredoxin
MGRRMNVACARGLAFLWMFAALTCAAAAPALTPWTGGSTPPLRLKDVKGAPHDLGLYKGRVVLVNFWATWCEPCRQEMPSIQRLNERFRGKAFDVLAINVDEPDARVRRFLEETRLEIPVLVDVNKTVTRGWGVRVMPTTFLVGPDGRIRYRLLGDIDWNTDAIAAVVSQLMNGD